jgi:hypothetical protein
MAKYEIKDGVGIIPEGTKKIVSDAFENCKDLTSIVIPNSVMKIGARAFRLCSGLTHIDIPHSVTEIEGSANRSIFRWRLTITRSDAEEIASLVR